MEPHLRKFMIFTTPILHLIITLNCLFCHRVQPLCHTDERTALLDFKNSFIIDRYASFDPLAYPKVASWIADEEDNDCCSWDGVECDEDNTHVIALHLNSSCLRGSINSSSSSLFHLSHLQILNLADNHFNYSLISSQLGNLPSLTYLNLSFSFFAGQIPLEISQLFNLSYLDLSWNYLELKQPNLSTLVRRFSYLRQLDLSEVDISSPVPSLLANFSSLTSLYLRACGLCGKFPNDIFQLPNLQFLNLAENENLTGSFTEFHSGNPMRELWLRKTGFFGHISSSIGNLTSLNVLDVAGCRFHGPLPSSLGKLSKLQSLDLTMNDLNGTVDFTMFLDMKNLTLLRLSGNKLSVLITESSNLNAIFPKFEVLSLGSCNLTSFPIFLRYQERLKILDLGSNHIHGKVPKWIWNTSIESLNIASNLFTSFDIDVLPSRSVSILVLSFNNFIGPLPIPPPTTTTLDVSHNKLSGEISPLIFNLSSLELLDLSHNNLSGVLPECLRNIIHNNPSSRGVVNPHTISRPQVMDLSYNQLQGRLPRSLLASCMDLKVLNLENNHFDDVFPSWLETLPKLKLLQLRSNHFHGSITSNSTSDNGFPSLKIIDLSHNNLSGPLPYDYFQKWNAMKDFDVRKSSYLGTTINLTLSKGSMEYQYIYQYSVIITNKGNDLEYKKILEAFRVINLSSNKFQGDIPECIGNLKGLQVLDLSNNMLTGSIPSPLSNITQLESLDLSRNKLSGKIPQQLAAQLTFLEFFNVSFNRLAGRIPQGSQFSTFDKSSYEGNEGLWGYPLQSLINTASPRGPFSPLDSDQEDGQASSSWFELYWITILPGFVGGLIFGVAMEQVLEMDKREWFIKAVKSFGCDRS